MKNTALFTLTALTLVCSTLTLTHSENGRLLANSEQDKPIKLTPKQWGFIAGGSVVLFLTTYMLLGLCCKSEIKTREASSTLTAGLSANMEESAETERPLET
jgi:hypothetical protein